MSSRLLFLAAGVTASVMFSSACGAQTLAPPLSITQRYVPPPEESPRAPPTLLVGDTPVVAVGPAEEMDRSPQSAMTVEASARPATAAPAPGQPAMTVSGTISGSRQRR